MFLYKKNFVFLKIHIVELEFNLCLFLLQQQPLINIFPFISFSNSFFPVKYFIGMLAMHFRQNFPKNSNWCSLLNVYRSLRIIRIIRGRDFGYVLYGQCDCTFYTKQYIRYSIYKELFQADKRINA